MKHLKVLLLMSLFCLVFFAGCGSAQAGQDPTTLQVTRMDQLSKDHPGLHSWTITDAHAVQQLFSGDTKLAGASESWGGYLCQAPLYLYPGVSGRNETPAKMAFSRTDLPSSQHSPSPAQRTPLIGSTSTLASSTSIAATR
jgi:hypothetical protein